MKKTERKVLEKKLYEAIEKVIEDNKGVLTKRTEKVINKSVKKIAKKFSNKKKSVSKKEIKADATVKKINLKSV